MATGAIALQAALARGLKLCMRIRDGFALPLAQKQISPAKYRAGYHSAIYGRPSVSLRQVQGLDVARRDRVGIKYPLSSLPSKQALIRSEYV
jgi:hypothetical protein